MILDDVGKRVLVTGGSGFIGRHLCRRLVELGADVTSLDLSPFPPPITGGDRPIEIHAAEGDVCDNDVVRNVLEIIRPSIVFHLAGASQVGDCFENPEETSFTNAFGTLTLLNECRGRDLRIVVSTSDKVYGQRDPHDGTLESERAFQFGFGEGDAFRPRHIYEASKGAADLFCQAYAYSYDERIAVLRCGNVFGPFDLNLDRIIPSVLMDEGELRKQLYGKAGALRYKEYGVEYRTLSNFWIFKEELIRWVWRNTARALENVSMDYTPYADEIQQAINNSDKVLAKKLIDQFQLEVV
jgi:nucleoside-diphosphate-sugar epimerase